MPTSFLDQIPLIVRLCQGLEPKSILDVGAGYGKFGVLLREYLDDWQGDLRLDAVEGWPDYLDRSKCDAYDRVWEEDWLHVGTRLAEDGVGYDLVIMIDVLEHWEMDRGRAAVHLARQVGGHVLISTPWEPAEQDAPYGNGYETHRSRWTRRDLRLLGGRYDDHSTSESLVVLLEGSR